MILNLRKLALIQKDDTNNGGSDTVVELININDGVDGAAVFGLVNEHDENQIEGGMVYTYAGNQTLDIRVLKPSAEANSAYSGQTLLQQLKDWADNQTDLYVSGITIDGFVLFGDAQEALYTIKIVANEQLSDNDIFALKITRKSDFGYNPDNGLYYGGFYAGKNALGMFAWGDADGDGTADGWSVTRFTDTFDTANGEQDLTDDDTTNTNLFGRLVYFPFVGESLTFSIDVNAFNEYGGDYNPRLILAYFDKDDSLISTDTQSISSTGRVSLTATVPATTVSIAARFASQQVSAGSQPLDVSLANPALRIDGGTTYTKF